MKNRRSVVLGVLGAFAVATPLYAPADRFAGSGPEFRHGEYFDRTSGGIRDCGIRVRSGKISTSCASAAERRSPGDVESSSESRRDRGADGVAAAARRWVGEGADLPAGGGVILEGRLVR